MPTEPHDLIPLHQRDFHILLALLEAPLHGYGLVKAIESRTEGGLRLDPANLYRALQRLGDDALVQEAPAPDEDVDSRRRYYAITGLGREVLRAEAERMRSLAAAVDATAAARPGLD